jgi:hypothetical protein
MIIHWGMKDVKNEISFFCIVHDINPKHILMNLSMCGLSWVLEDLSSKIYLSERFNSIVREKIKILHIFSSSYQSIFDILDSIKNTDDINKKLKLWEEYYVTLSELSPKLEKYVTRSNNNFYVKPKFLLEFVKFSCLENVEETKQTTNV